MPVRSRAEIFFSCLLGRTSRPRSGVEHQAMGEAANDRDEREHERVVDRATVEVLEACRGQSVAWDALALDPCHVIVTLVS